MVVTDEVREIFADAHFMYEGAIERWAAGDVRDAAEKAWCATKRATDALILARTGELPETTGMTSTGIRLLGESDRAFENLVGRYYTRIGHLHGECFYEGNYITQDTERRIRETIDYVRDAEALAFGDNEPDSGERR